MSKGNLNWHDKKLGKFGTYIQLDNSMVHGYIIHQNQ